MAWSLPAAVASFAVPAWAVRATAVFSEYAPFSWVAAGFAGLLSASVCYALVGVARVWWVRSRYDKRLIAKSGNIDPLASTFERKRIYMNDFVLPSKQLIEGKTFIECEIVGPVNLVMDGGNNINEPKFPKSDAILVKNNSFAYNGVYLRNCVFRGCSFSRITFMIYEANYGEASHIEWLNWINGPAVPLISPSGDPKIPAPQQPPPGESSDDHDGKI